MKIAHKLALLTIVPLVLLVLIYAIALTTYRAMSEARATSRFAATLETQVFALGLLSYDYLRHYEPRVQAQWQRVAEALDETLRQPRVALLSPAALGQLQGDYQGLTGTFRRLVETPVAGAAPAAGSLAEEQRSWLTARLIAHTQEAFTTAATLRQMAEQRIDEQQMAFYTATLALLALIGAISAALAWRTGMAIRTSLGRLRHAADAMAAGNLDYRAETGTKDEHAELAQALNAMARHLKGLQRQVVQSEKLAALGTLAAGVAHELNNPLMGVMNYLAYVRRSVQDPALQHPLERAYLELIRIRDLIRNMLTFARPASGEPAPVDLPAVLERAVELLAAELRVSGIELEQAVPKGLPPVSGKEGPLQQVFLNLLLNARDAVQASAQKRIVLRGYESGQAVCVEVRDTGEGIPESVRERIFDPFFTTKPAGKGTGLGLSIAQSLVLEFGGDIEVQSREGAGTVFTVKLPKA
jgi:signal transduction histidine kinase